MSESPKDFYPFLHIPFGPQKKIRFPGPFSQQSPGAAWSTPSIPGGGSFAPSASGGICRLQGEGAFGRVSGRGLARINKDFPAIPPGDSRQEEGMTSIEEYLAAIGAEGPGFVERINTILRVASEICPEKIQGFFISEFLQPEGERLFDNLFLISESYVIEARSFLAKFDTDITYYRNSIININTSFEHYNFTRATQKSKLTIRCSLENRPEGPLNLTATGKNCDYLKRIIITYFKPNLKELKKTGIECPS
jgi:hypothetical protein